MNISAIPQKCVSLSKLPIKDVKTRRLFILSDGKRSLKEIYSLSAVTEEKGLELIQQLVGSKYLSIEAEVPQKSKTASQRGNIESTVFVKLVTQELAKYVGPFASVLMDSLDVSGEQLSPESQKRVIDIVSKEIEGQKEKSSFLMSLKRSGLG